MTRSFFVVVRVALVLALVAAAPARAQAPADAGAVEPPPYSPAPSAVPATPVAPTSSAAPASTRPLRFFASMGYDHGLEDLLEVQFEDGDDQTLTLNGGFTLGVGAAFLPLQNGRFETRATIGLKYDSIEASNGSVRYLAFPLELAEALNVRPVRLSLGLSYLLGPNVEGEDFLAATDIEMKNSLGVFGQVEYVLPLRATGGSLSFGLRYTAQKLERKVGGTSAADANAIGGVLGLTL